MLSFCPFISLMNNETKIRHIADMVQESEKNIEAYLVRRCEGLRWQCLKFVSQNAVGYPDRMILIPGGRVAFAEVKSAGKQPRPIQRHRMEQLAKAGFAVAVVSSCTDVENFVHSLEKAAQ